MRVAGARWSIEMGFEITQDQLGLDNYEVRSWGGWERHVTLVLLAHVLSVIRAQALVTTAQQGAATS